MGEAQLMQCRIINTEALTVIEKKEPPIYNTPEGNGSVLHRFTGFPSDRATILAARRCPAVTTPVGNTAKHISVYTSTGFQKLTVDQFAAATSTLQPDVVIPVADLPHTVTTPHSKKLLRMTERTEEWVDELITKIGTHTSAIFAPVLPVEHPLQWSYLKYLSEDLFESLSGLAVYDVNLLPDVGTYAPLADLPRLSVDPPKTPHDVLRQVSLGADVCVVPFVNSVSDAGVALTFTFPPPTSTSGEAAPQPLGIDMWPPEQHKTSLAPLVEGCSCYTCTRHHRAFVNHLLNAKEMLGWNLLQVHNHHVLDLFFTGIRQALGQGGGPTEFETLSSRFTATYEPELPAGTGDRPRARGYHFKSETNQPKFNDPAWDADLSGRKESRDAKPISQAETPLEPDVDGAALASQGFAQKLD